MSVTLFAGFYLLLTTKAKLFATLMITGVARHNSSKLGSALASTVIHYAQTTLLFNANNFLKSISAHHYIAFLSIKFNSSLLTPHS